MLDQKKIDELYAWLEERDFIDGPAFGAIVRDKLDDVLHDAYGCGVVDERKRIVADLRSLAATEVEMTSHPLKPLAVQCYDMLAKEFADRFEAGKHDSVDPKHAARCAKLSQPRGESP